MTMNPRRQGFESVLYVRTAGNYATPTWSEIDLAGDLNRVDSVPEVKVTTRGIARRRYEASDAGIRPWGFDFDILVPAAGETNTPHATLEAARKAGSEVDILHVEGGDISIDGLAASRGVCKVLGGELSEPMNGPATQRLQIRFTPNSSQDSPVTGTTASGAFVAAS
jgi:hypothetical protein